MRRYLIGGAALLAILAGILWLKSDRRRIEKALDRFERACEKEGPDSALSLLGRSQTIIKTFAPGFLVSARPYEVSISNAQELAGTIFRYRAMSERVRIRDSARTLSIRDNGTAEMTARLDVEGARSSGFGATTFDATIFWVEHEGEWKIREMQLVELVGASGPAF